MSFAVHAWSSVVATMGLIPQVQETAESRLFYSVAVRHGSAVDLNRSVKAIPPVLFISSSSQVCACHCGFTIRTATSQSRMPLHRMQLKRKTF